MSPILIRSRPECHRNGALGKWTYTSSGDSSKYATLTAIEHHQYFDLTHFYPAFKNPNNSLHLRNLQNSSGFFKAVSSFFSILENSWWFFPHSSVFLRILKDSSKFVNLKNTWESRECGECEKSEESTMKRRSGTSILHFLEKSSLPWKITTF